LLPFAFPQRLELGLLALLAHALARLSLCRGSLSLGHDLPIALFDLLGPIGPVNAAPRRRDELRHLRASRSMAQRSRGDPGKGRGPMTPKAFHALFGRIGARANMQFPIHPHMLRHGCGYALANAGHDTRALQASLGHKNIQHTVRYTELAPDRFKNFWR
jgi:integrase